MDLNEPQIVLGLLVEALRMDVPVHTRNDRAAAAYARAAVYAFGGRARAQASWGITDDPSTSCSAQAAPIVTQVRSGSSEWVDARRTVVSGA